MNAKQIRAFLLLKENEDGRTASEIARNVRSSRQAVSESLHTMVDAFIDRYQWEHNRWTAVWTVVVVPENCPPPDRKATA